MSVNDRVRLAPWNGYSSDSDIEELEERKFYKLLCRRITFSALRIWSAPARVLYMIARALRPGAVTFRRLETRCRRPLLPHRSWRGLCSVSDDDGICQHENGSTPSDTANIFPGAQHGGDKMAIVFTCRVCNTRTGKTMTKVRHTPPFIATPAPAPLLGNGVWLPREDRLTRAAPPQQAYHHGVVLARCPGCDNLHLIADRLGWFEEESTDIMDIIRKRGEEAKFVRSEEDLLELALEDVAGADKVEEAVREATAGSSAPGAEVVGRRGAPAGARGEGEGAQ